MISFSSYCLFGSHGFEEIDSVLELHKFRVDSVEEIFEVEFRLEEFSHFGLFFDGLSY